MFAWKKNIFIRVCVILSDIVGRRGKRKRKLVDDRCIIIHRVRRRTKRYSSRETMRTCCLDNRSIVGRVTIIFKHVLLLSRLLPPDRSTGTEQSVLKTIPDIFSQLNRLVRSDEHVSITIVSKRYSQNNLRIVIFFFSERAKQTIFDTIFYIIPQNHIYSIEIR